MTTKSVVRFDENKYSSDGFERVTSASPHSPRTIIKYITPRVVPSNITSSFQGFSRGIAWSNVGSSFPTPATTSYGLASLVQSSIFTTVSSIHSINGERIIDEHRELARITEILANTVVTCYNLEAHNRAQELQIEWLRTHRSENSSIIERMFRTEMESAKNIVHESSQHKSTADRKVNDMQKKTSAYEEQYQQLLSKANALSKELFDYERKIAQNNAEAQFLQRRKYHLDDQMKFYLGRNQNLHSRRVRIRYELDEEIFSYQSIKIELEILQKEKITSEDVRIAALDDIRNSVDVSFIAGIRPSQYFCDHLNQEVQRLRNEYEQKIEVFREELHRQFELALHRYSIEKSRQLPTVTQEHRDKLEQWQSEKNDLAQEIACQRARNNEINNQIEAMGKQIRLAKTSRSSSYDAERYLANLNHFIQERERYRDEILRKRMAHKQKIENYRDRLDRYSRQKLQNYNKRTSVLETSPPSVKKSPVRYSFQELPIEDDYDRPVTPRLPPTTTQSTSPGQRLKHSSIIQVEELGEQGTLAKHLRFNVDEDCEELRRLLTNTYIDEIAIIKILCNRSVSQRLQIRDKYKSLYNSNLGDALETIVHDSLSRLLRILLMSPVERDCFELQRILRRSNVDENILTEIFFSRSNQHIQQLKDAYQKLFRTTLEEDIIGDRDHPSKRIFAVLLHSNRPEDDYVNHNDILKDARELYETESKWQRDGSTFLRLLCTRSNLQLRQIFAAYQQFSNNDIEQTIKFNIEGSLYCALTAIVRMIRNRPRFFAHALKKNIKGAATNEENLNRIIVSRCEIDTVQIKSEYEKIAKRTLYDHIQTDINGNYKRALLELLRQRNEPTGIELTLKHSNERTKISQNRTSDRPSVQWREPLKKTSTNTYQNDSLARSNSDRGINERRQRDDDQTKVNPSNAQPYRNNQLNTRNSLPVNPKSPRTQYISRRPFVPMKPTYENPSHFNDDDDDQDKFFYL